ncbi:rho guanine nucleotide exchange factor 26 isoform X2 [Pogoniulus pusillus]|uniref:rho guanine nucleotide exchange factor 26 isoform X2 n=1 Tax=Pogoniulus pusillus TaxID=488313 RepID=UPI0030B95A1E
MSLEVSSNLRGSMMLFGGDSALRLSPRGSASDCGGDIFRGRRLAGRCSLSEFPADRRFVTCFLRKKLLLSPRSWLAGSKAAPAAASRLWQSSRCRDRASGAAQVEGGHKPLPCVGVSVRYSGRTRGLPPVGTAWTAKRPWAPGGCARPGLDVAPGRAAQRSLPAPRERAAASVAGQAVLPGPEERAMDAEALFTDEKAAAAPRLKRRSTPRPQPLAWSKARPQSYQSPNGVLFTDFPVEDRCTFTVTQPAGTVSTCPGSAALRRGPSPFGAGNGSVSNGEVRPPARNAVSPERPSQVPAPVSDSSAGFAANGAVPSAGSRPGPPLRTCSQAALTPQQEQIVFAASPQPSPAPAVGDAAALPSQCSRLARPAEKAPPGTPAGTRAVSPEEGVTAASPASPEEEPPGPQPVVLSTHSPAALKVGTQQIIPKGLASETKVTSKGSGQHAEPGKRVLKARSMVESPSLPLMADAEEEAEGELDSPGTLRRGLRSTSYRRAVVSGVDFDSSLNFKKKNRMSQPILKAVVEDKEKFASLGRLKKKMLKGQGTFDGEENAVLYQNYKEKALDIDSDEESEPQEQKSDEKVVFHHKPLRSTWSQLSVVKKNGLSEAISQEERKRQEAIFEVISSEHSYLLSLEILIRMFKNSRELSLTMTKTESHHLFSNITDVYEASKKFFTELEARHQSSICIDDISDIVEKHSSAFDPYVKYCTNEVYQQRTLQKLLATNPAFKEALSRIEAHEDCRSLPMISFLILPMQRVTRLPLLMDTICQKTPKDSPKYENCKRALKEVSKLVRLCNEGARKMERTEMMYTINSQLEFKIKPFPLVSSSRWLLKRGELTAYVEEPGLFSKRTSKQQVYFFLFNDVLIITKKKSEESYNVTDYSLRDQLVVQQCDGEDLTSSPVKNTSTMLYSRQSSAAHLFRLAVLSNHAGERVELLLGTDTPSDRARWITALGRDRDRQTTDRTTLTQVEITRTYTAKQSDELSLQVADVVLVYQKVNDGWYEGERLRDGERGWFPMECAKEITCRATLDKNMERMGRLLGLETNV